MHHVDGNAAIGALSLATGTDVGAATLVCAVCGNHHPVAETHVYRRCPGLVMRCPNCTATEIVLVEIEHRIHLTLRNVRTLDLGTSNR